MKLRICIFFIKIFVLLCQSPSSNSSLSNNSTNNTNNTSTTNSSSTPNAGNSSIPNNSTNITSTNNSSSTPNVGNSSSGSNSTLNNFLFVDRNSSWTMLYAVILIRSPTYTISIDAGNCNIDTLKSNPLKNTNDYFSVDSSSSINNYDAISPNSTIEKNISNYIINRYYINGTNNISIKNSVFITFNLQIFKNYMINIIRFITGNTKIQFYFQQIKKQNLNDGSLAVNSNQLSNINIIDDLQIVPDFGLRFTQINNICPKYYKIVNENSMGTGFYDYINSHFSDIRNSWENAFSNLKCDYLYKSFIPDGNNLISSNILLDYKKDIKKSAILSNLTDQFIFDYEINNNTINTTLQKFYINGSVDRIYELKKFFLYELKSSSPIHNSILVEPLMDLLVNLTNAYTDNTNSCNLCNSTKSLNRFVIEVEDIVFSALNKFIMFGYYTNNSFFESYKSLPPINAGYHLAFELWTDNKTNFYIIINDQSGIMNGQYNISSFRDKLDSFIYTPILNTMERQSYCNN